jgi:hypothetical protein
VSSATLYDRLEVERTAAAEEIRKAWKRRAFELHPDRGGNEDLFKAALEAYQTLSDPVRRAVYDAYGTVGRSRPAPPERPACLLARWYMDHGARELDVEEVEAWAEWTAPELRPGTAAKLRGCQKLVAGYRMRTRLRVLAIVEGRWVTERVWWVERSPWPRRD